MDIRNHSRKTGAISSQELQRKYSFCAAGSSGLALSQQL